jgi:hypothetical protein
LLNPWIETWIAVAGLGRVKCWEDNPREFIFDEDAPICMPRGEVPIYGLTFT